MSMTLREAKRLLKAAIKERKLERVLRDVSHLVSSVEEASVDALIEEMDIDLKDKKNPFRYTKGSWNAPSKVSEIWYLFAMIHLLNQAKTKKAKSVRESITVLHFETENDIDLSIVSNFSNLKMLMCTTNSYFWKAKSSIINGQNLPDSLTSIQAQNCIVKNVSTIYAPNLQELVIGTVIGSLQGLEALKHLRKLSINQLELEDSTLPCPVFGGKLEQLSSAHNGDASFPKINFSGMQALQELIRST